MPRLGRPDEVVVRDVQHRQRGRETSATSRSANAGVGTPGLPGRPLDFLAVLVGPGQEEHVVAHQAVRARDRVGHHRRVRVAEVRLRVDVVDRRGDVEAAHDVRRRRGARRTPAAAMACTSLTGQVVGRGESRAVLEFRHGVDDAAVPPGELEPDRADGVSTRTISRCRHSRSTSWCRRPIVVVSRKIDVGQRRAPFGRRDDRQQRARPVLLHLHRHVEHFERAGRVQPIHRRRRRSAGSCRRSRTR